MRERPAPLDCLTVREAQCLRLLARGHNREDIAAALGISPHTAQVHLSALYQRLGVHAATEAAAVYWARRVELAYRKGHADALAGTYDPRRDAEELVAALRGD